MHNDDFKYKEITDKILRAFYNVYNKLGYGFLEKVYEHAMIIELRKFGLNCNAQVPIKVHYDGYLIGDYFADIIVNNCVIIENKAMESLCPEHEAQLLNYLKATDIEVGLLLNFGQKPQFKRKVFSNQFKK
jgi:GxxExxY protein